MVDGGGLENRFPERGRGFESYSLRQKICMANFTCSLWLVAFCLWPVAWCGKDPGNPFIDFQLFVFRCKIEK